MIHFQSGAEAPLGLLQVQAGLKPVLKVENPSAAVARRLARQAARLGLELLADGPVLWISREAALARRAAALTHREAAGERAATGELARLLGYPPCCGAVFVDYTPLDDTREFVMTAYWRTRRRFCPELNNLSADFLIHHQPCGYDCAPSLELARRSLELLDGQEADRRLAALSRSVLFFDHGGSFWLKEGDVLAQAEAFISPPARRKRLCAQLPAGPLTRGAGHWRNLPPQERPPLLLPFGQDSPVRHTPALVLLVQTADENNLPHRALAPLLAADLRLMGHTATVCHLHASSRAESLAPWLREKGFNLALLLGRFAPHWERALAAEGLPTVGLTAENPFATYALPALHRLLVSRLADALAHGEISPGPVTFGALGLSPEITFSPQDHQRDDALLNTPESLRAKRLAVVHPGAPTEAVQVLGGAAAPPCVLLAHPSLAQLKTLFRRLEKTPLPATGAELVLQLGPEELAKLQPLLQNAAPFLRRQHLLLTVQTPSAENGPAKKTPPWSMPLGAAYEPGLWRVAALQSDCENRCAACGFETLKPRTPRLFSQVNGQNVLFTGLDPLRHADLARLIATCRRYGALEVRVKSHAGGLLPERTRLLREAGLDGLDWFCLGPNARVADAVAQREGAFAASCKGMEIAREAGLVVRPVMMVFPRQLALARHTFSWLKKEGFDEVILRVPATGPEALFRALCAQLGPSLNPARDKLDNSHRVIW